MLADYTEVEREGRPLKLHGGKMEWGIQYRSNQVYAVCVHTYHVCDCCV